ncbi:GNAT family N-acetyltransferase [Streptomyces sp. PR69]|uniref:GNAT family N-acetyltransferase n=1 Tax=Streptomyces sp. PR69 TaxID=2984950 RepID=UPI002264608C|nr:GNAT family N-acetyltransferase [Streptomyces sp. PR69]
MALPRPATLLPRAPRPHRPSPAASAESAAPAAPAAFSVRTAHPRDAAELAALSQPFISSGALRPRPFHVYAQRASDFLVAEGPDGALDGCLALRLLPEPAHDGRAAGVVYNFCVAHRRQGSGVGARLLAAALAQGLSRSLDALFTATTGSGRLFLRYGFAPVSADLAPVSWARSLDPRRNAQVLARVL